MVAFTLKSITSSLSYAYAFNLLLFSNIYCLMILQALIYDASAQNLLDLQANSSKYGLLIPNRLFVGALGDDVTSLKLMNTLSRSINF